MFRTRSDQSKNVHVAVLRRVNSPAAVACGTKWKVGNLVHLPVVLRLMHGRDSIVHIRDKSDDSDGADGLYIVRRERLDRPVHRMMSLQLNDRTTLATSCFDCLVGPRVKCSSWKVVAMDHNRIAEAMVISHGTASAAGSTIPVVVRPEEVKETFP